MSRRRVRPTARTALGPNENLESANGSFSRSDALRIHHLTPLYQPVEGGAERHVKIVSERLVARGHEVTVVTLNVKSDYDLYHRIAADLPADETINGVRVIRLSPSTGPVSWALGALQRVRGGYRLSSQLLTADGLQMLLRFPRNLRPLRFLVSHPAEIVGAWNWHWPLAYQAYLARRLKRLSLVGVPLFHTAQEWSGRGIYDRMLESCAGLIVNTAHERDFIAGRTNRAPPTLVAGVGIEPADFESADGRAFRARHGLGDGPVVGFVGRMIPSKGADTVVEAMGQVWGWRSDVQLLLAGQRSNPFPRLDRLLDELPERQRKQVRMLPDFPEAEKAHLLDAIDLLVLPSTGESFGIAYLEAWCRGKPVIGSRIGSTACVIEEERDGLLVDPHDAVEIGRSIIRVLRNAAWGAELGRRGRAKTLDRHTWQRVVDRVEVFYKRIATMERSSAS